MQSGQVQLAIDKISEMGGITVDEARYLIEKFVSDYGGVQMSELPAMILQEMLKLVNQVQDPGFKEILEVFIAQLTR